MKIGDIITLAKSGYTKKDIDELMKITDQEDSGEQPKSTAADLIKDMVDKINHLEQRINSENIERTEVTNNTNTIDPAEVIAGMMR